MKLLVWKFFGHFIDTEVQVRSNLFLSLPLINDQCPRLIGMITGSGTRFFQVHLRDLDKRRLKTDIDCLLLNYDVSDFKFLKLYDLLVG